MGGIGYLVSELIRQLAQIRVGIATSEKAKGKARDKNRMFYVAHFDTTKNLLRSMAATLRQKRSKASAPERSLNRSPH